MAEKKTLEGTTSSVAVRGRTNHLLIDADEMIPKRLAVPADVRNLRTMEHDKRVIEARAKKAVKIRTEHFDVYTRIQHRPFPGGKLLRTPALMLAMSYYRLRDYF